MADLQAVIFDYYETLVELTQPIRERHFDQLAREAGVALTPGEAYRHWRELTTSDWALRLGGERAPLNGATPPFVTFREVWRQRSEELFQQWGADLSAERGGDAYANLHAAAEPYPDVVAALGELNSYYKLAVLSDADDDFLLSNIRRNGMRFETVVSSEASRAYKPHVSLFNDACARLGVQPAEAVYVGDSPWADIEGARHAGLRAVWINRHGVDWPEGIGRPQHEIASLDELAALL
ncbi:MAG: HAD-IA family hydrolase [Chloroflexi bacterium]|nr:HAD-IA family hydrolase [Chloroflexota bacterium]